MAEDFAIGFHLKTAAAKPAVIKNLDDLIREYGMEQEAAFVDSGDW